jgi:hypothetical protein
MEGSQGEALPLLCLQEPAHLLQVMLLEWKIWRQLQQRRRLLQGCLRHNCSLQGGAGALLACPEPQLPCYRG